MFGWHHHYLGMQIAIVIFPLRMIAGAAATYPYCCLTSLPNQVEPHRPIGSFHLAQEPHPPLLLHALEEARK